MTLLIGHRGVGKTTYLKHVHAKFPTWTALDLDREVECVSGLSVSEIFSLGEPIFREWEKKVLNKIVSETPGPAVIALGAGFEGPLPEREDIHVLWLRRVTDSKGRIFTDRPRLNRELSPIEEYIERFHVREERFQRWADEELILPEGYDGGLEAFLQTPQWNLQADLTLLGHESRDFIKKREAWGLRRFEVRDDLLNEAQIEDMLSLLPKDKVLFSLRSANSQLRLSYKSDWALELGTPPEGATVVSRHERDTNLENTLTDLSSYKNKELKLAVEIANFAELWKGHLWWQEDPTKRSFLPRSKNGRWRWYRSLFGAQMPLYFIREDKGSALDQPYLWQTVLQPKLKTRFAAVLGSPIEHSRSPLEHLDFFKKHQIPFVGIEITEDEWSSAIPVLQRLGLTYAAVTSPLKRKAFQICTDLDKDALTLESVNTLVFDQKQILGRNTDQSALVELAHELDFKKVWLWGGGGVRSSVQKAWPQTLKISAREGTAETGSPDLLIWAVDRSRRFEWPSSKIRPQLVLDLNYGDDSPGREWAVQNNIGYQSGLKMFKLQAAAQQRFWRKYI